MERSRRPNALVPITLSLAVAAVGGYKAIVNGTIAKIAHVLGASEKNVKELPKGLEVLFRDKAARFFSARMQWMKAVINAQGSEEEKRAQFDQADEKVDERWTDFRDWRATSVPLVVTPGSPDARTYSEEWSRIWNEERDRNEYDESLHRFFVDQLSKCLERYRKNSPQGEYDHRQLQIKFMVGILLHALFGKPIDPSMDGAFDNHINTTRNIIVMTKAAQEVVETANFTPEEGKAILEKEIPKDKEAALKRCLERLKILDSLDTLRGTIDDHGNCFLTDEQKGDIFQKAVVKVGLAKTSEERSKLWAMMLRSKDGEWKGFTFADFSDVVGQEK